MKPEHYNHIKEALALMNSMIACGEDHTNTSRAALARAFDALNAASNAAPAVPEGWKLMPPITEEMHVAAVKVLQRASGLDGLPQRMIDAMINAAPAQEGKKK